MRRKLDQKRWTADDARRELEGWRRSGDSMAAYCQRRGYQAQRLSWWRKRLEAVRSEAREAAAVRLAPAVVTGSARTAVVVTIDADGIRLEIDDPAAVHPAWIAELAEALGLGAAA